MVNKIKILFALPKLTAGGAERVISFVAQNLDKEIFDVTLVIVGFEKDNKYNVSGVSTIYLNKSRVLKSVFSLINTISKLKPQIVVSSITDLNVMMGLISVFFSNTIFIGRHTFIIKTKTSADKSKNENKSLIKSIFNYGDYGYKRLDYFICQSTDMKQSIINAYGIDQKKIKVINNPITRETILKTEQALNKERKYITIGRLSKLKGYIRLLEILSQLSFPFQYTIIGEGNYYHEIFKKINELGLNNKVTYIKYTDNVYKYLVEQDMFLQGSFSEGFPNALLESCAVGTPVIAFDVPGGTKEIVEDDVNGYLVDTKKEFLEKLKESKQWDPERVRKTVHNKFSKSKIICDYQNFFKEILK